MLIIGMGSKLNVITDIQSMGRKINEITDIQSMGRKLKIFRYVDNRYG